MDIFVIQVGGSVRNGSDALADNSWAFLPEVRDAKEGQGPQPEDHVAQSEKGGTSIRWLRKNSIPCRRFSYSATTSQIFSSIFFREAHARKLAQPENWRLRPGKEVCCTVGNA